jgi:NitT/TauT family transport system substrate-binding protein
MRRSQILATASAAALTLAARPSFVRAEGALEKVTIAGVQTEDMTNIFYAVKSGLFAKNGLDVELVATATGSASTTAVIAGTYNMAKTSTLPVFLAHLRDVPVIMVAPELLNQAKNPFAMLQIAPDSQIKTGADLNGKTIAVTALNDVNTLAVRAWVDKNGGDWRSLKIVEIPNGATEAAIAQHRVDAGIIQTPQLDASLAAGTTKSLGDAWSAIAPNFMIGVYVARPDWAAQHVETLHRFNRAYIEATKYVNTHITETIPYAAELAKMEPEKVAKMRRSQNGTALNASELQAVIDASVKYETLPRGFSAKEVIWNG